MNLQEAWNKLGKEKLNKPVLGSVHVKGTSKHPVQKLIFGFKLTLGLAVVIGCAFLFLFFIMPQAVVKAGLGLMVIVYIWFFVINFRSLKEIQRSFKLDQNLKITLQQIYQNTTATLAFQRKASLIIYPFAAASGFFLGLSVETDVVTMMQKPFVIIALFVSVIVLTPASYFLAKWLEAVTWKKYLKQLKELIEEVDKEEAIEDPS